MKTEILQGYRTFIGFLVGTGLVAWCLWLSREQPQNYNSFLMTWTGIYGVFVTKNYHQGKKDVGND